MIYATRVLRHDINIPKTEFYDVPHNFTNRITMTQMRLHRSGVIFSNVRPAAAGVSRIVTGCRRAEGALLL